MAIVQISKIQQRRGLQQDLPSLASAEFGWSIDSRRLYIGNGTLAEGAPALGRTEILTEFSIINFTNGLTGNVTALQTNVAILQSNIVTINAEIAALQTGTTTANAATLIGGTSGSVTSVFANNASISYTVTQGSKQRTGVLSMSRYGSSASYDDEYNETGTTNLTFNVTANATALSVNYATTTTSTLIYRTTYF